MKEHDETWDKIVPIDIEREMKKSYIDYAMSVIVGRALPDVRDGLKPVHRRILYAMNELGMTPDKPYRKSARIVGDVLGKYHPHGDSAVYDTIVRMAQEFKYRYMLADGHGNFGSIDGDGAAAMRYTEVRMSKIAMELLADINKNTVDFVPNFDGELKEPSVLPARFPHLLVNGTDGIAVGMATSIPPHHLGEVIDGVIKMIDNKVHEERETDVEELIDIIKAPDFPTGATIYGVAGINQAYRTGRGKVVIRAKAEIEDMGNKQRIIVTEIPFQVNKARLVEKIAELVKEKKIEGISDLRDESNRHGIRIVIELKRDANAHVLLNQLYKYTQMQESIGITMLALVNNQPRILNLKQILEYYIDHQKEVITRRTQFELDKAAARAHILEGLRIALDHIDEVIRLIRGSRTTQEAKEGLINEFGLTEKQAQAIVDMRLRSLTGLEREKIEEEFKELMKKIEYYRSILGDENLLYGVIREEILSIKERYADERRTEIVHAAGDIDIEDLIDEEQIVITMSHFGYIKRQPIDTYKAQNRGGKGIIAMQTREEDFVEDVFISSTHAELLFFTNLGKVYSMKAYHVPEASRQAKGTAIVNLLQLQPEEKISAIIPIRNFEDGAYLFMVTKQGLIKKTQLKAYANIRKGGMIGICLRDEDQLVEVRMTQGNQDFIIATRKGMAIRFNEKDARPLGRTAMGVKGITLESNDYVIAMAPCREDASILTVCENGLGKRTSLEEYSSQNRGGKGVKNYKLSDKTGDVIAMKAIRENDDVVLVTSEGVLIRLRANEISKMGRATQGVKLINVAEDIKVVSLARIADAAEDTHESEIFEENE